MPEQYAFSPKAINRERRNRLLAGTLILGLIAALSSTFLLFDRGAVALLWICFAILWGGLFFFARHPAAENRLWLVSAVLCVVAFVLPCALLLSLQIRNPLWLVLTLVLVVAFGIIPWRLGELLPLLFVALAIGLKVAVQMNLAMPGFLLFIIASMISTYLSVSSFRQVAQQFVVTSFQGRVAAAKHEEEVESHLASALKVLFDAESVLITRYHERAQVLHGNQSYRVRSTDPSIDQLWQIAHQGIKGAECVGKLLLNNMSDEFQLSDDRFADVKAKCGIILLLTPELVSPLPTISSAKQEDVAEPVRYLIFIPMDSPVWESLLAHELHLAHTILVQAALRFVMFQQSEGFTARQRRYAAMEAEREYELSSLVHDINNAVQDLTMLCDATLSDYAASEPEGNLSARIKRITVNARAIATIVSDLRRRGELKRSEQLRAREVVNVVELASELLEYAELRAERRRLTICARGIEDASPLWVRISAREHLETVIRTLLNNAFKHSEAGSEVELVVRGSDEWVWVDVVDTGPGFSKEEAQRLFASSLGDSAIRQGSHGTGLRECRNFAESQGGLFEISSDGAGRGATMTITLPRDAGTETAQPVGGHWALIVDDDPALTRLYSRIIKALHLTPVIANSVAEAQQLVAKRSVPRIVMSDLQLGDADGADLVKDLRQRFGDGVPIIVVSGMNDVDVEERVLAAGASTFLAKPVGQRVLFERLQDLIHNRKADTRN